MSYNESVADRRTRALLFRKENKAGVKEIIQYLRQRELIEDPLLWPSRPELSFIGVKNGIERLRSDLESRRLFPIQETGNHVKIVCSYISSQQWHY